MTQPICLDGEPENLEAASADALEWLKIMLEYIHVIRGQARLGQRLQADRDNLQRLIEIIQALVPNSKPIHKRTGEPTPQGWAKVVDIIEVDRQ